MSSTFDAEAIRADFPILGKSFRGKSLAYLDNASTSQKPAVVIEAVANYYRESNSNVHRGIYALAEEAFASRGAIESDVEADSGCPCSGCLLLSASCLVLLLLAVLLFGFVIWFAE